MALFHRWFGSSDPGAAADPLAFPPADSFPDPLPDPEPLAACL